jgi:hypothetical protein
MFDNYPLSPENASFDIVIWHGHLWRGRFQKTAKEERQVTGGNGRKPSGRKESILSGYGRFLAR